MQGDASAIRDRFLINGNKHDSFKHAPFTCGTGIGKKITRQNPVQHIGFANVARSKSGNCPNMKSTCESGRKLCEDAILCQMSCIDSIYTDFNCPCLGFTCRIYNDRYDKGQHLSWFWQLHFFCGGACNVSFLRTQTENQKLDTQTDSNSNPIQFHLKILTMEHHQTLWLLFCD